VGRFEPEYLGKLNFYLEALDRDVRKAHEQQPSACCFARARMMKWWSSRSVAAYPTALIAEYQTQSSDKKLLKAKLHEFYLQNAPDQP
jgi:hypothetical protein